MKIQPELKKWKALAKYDLNQAASEFCEMPEDQRSRVISSVGIGYLTDIVRRLATDAAAEFMRNLPSDRQSRILLELEPQKRDWLNEILSYKPGTAGALMAKEILSIPLNSTIQQATEYLQTLPQDKKGKVSYIYVVDSQNHLEGVIQIRDLVFFPGQKPVKELLKSPVVQVETGMTQWDVAKLLERHRYLGLPVVNTTQKLVGVISADSAMRVFEKRASDDIAKIVGTSAEEINAPSMRNIMRHRLPWLVVNIISGLLCAFISGLFQQRPESIAALFLFVPVVLGLSESIGVQGATVVVRNMALGHVSLKDLGSLFFREFLAGILIGIICGGAVGLFGSLWLNQPLLGWALSASMIVAILFSALIGLMLPMIFKRFRVDPAFASGPFVLAVCDIQTLLIYFNLSGFILSR